MNEAPDLNRSSPHDGTAAIRTIDDVVRRLTARSREEFGDEVEKARIEEVVASAAGTCCSAVSPPSRSASCSSDWPGNGSRCDPSA